MPVLDANALKTDPKGAAFLLSVLRRTRQTRSPFEKSGEQNRTAPDSAKLRERLLHGVTFA